jgi:hypothetical protein
MDTVMRIYRRLEKLELCIRCSTNSRVHHMSASKHMHAIPRLPNMSLTVINLLFFLTCSHLPIKGTVGQTGGTVRRGENPRRLAGRHLLHVCFGHARTPFLPPCSKIDWRGDRFADDPDEPESVCHARPCWGHRHTSQVCTLIHVQSASSSGPDAYLY